jgi:hypothetical protein
MASSLTWSPVLTEHPLIVDSINCENKYSNAVTIRSGSRTMKMPKAYDISRRESDQ